MFLLAISEHDDSFQVGPGDTFYRCYFSDVGRWQSLVGYPGLTRHLKDPEVSERFGDGTVETSIGLAPPWPSNCLIACGDPKVTLSQSRRRSGHADSRI